MFRALRIHQRFPTRRKRPTTLAVIEGEKLEGVPIRDLRKREVPVLDAPGVLVLPIFQAPGILFGLPPRNKIDLVSLVCCPTTADAEQRQLKLKASGIAGALTHVRIDLWAFLRTLAKIAHGYDVANFGIANSDDTLNRYILREDDKVPYLVGGTPSYGPLSTVVPMPHDNSGLHQVYAFGVVIDGLGYIGVQIRLFAHLRPLTPLYTVVMRRHNLPEGEPYFEIITKTK